MRLKQLLVATLLATGVAMMPVTARADYVGQTINGTLAFGPNGANGGQFWNPSSIVDPGTFFYHDGANTDTVTFTGTTMTITDQVILGANGWEMTFTDAAMPFGLLTLVSSNFAPGITESLSAGKITVDWVGTLTAGVTYTAVFNIAGANRVPEPTSLTLLGIALAGLGFSRRRKLN